MKAENSAARAMSGAADRGSKARDNADLDRCVDGGSLGILKVDLSQRKRHSDGKDNDDKSHKSPIRGLGLFFAVILPLQIGHRDASLCIQSRTTF